LSPPVIAVHPKILDVSGVGPSADDGSNESGVGVLLVGVLLALLLLVVLLLIGVPTVGVLLVVPGDVSRVAAVAVVGSERNGDAGDAGDAELVLHEVISRTPITTLEMAVG
jgi:hypothetical protein